MPRAVEAYSYGCLMAMLPEPVAKRVRAFAALIPDEDIYETADGEHGREEHCHITIKYGLHTDDGQLVADVVSSQYVVGAKLGRMSVFENDKYVVLKIDVDSPEIHALNQYVSDMFEVTDGFPVYHPHVTVAYLRKGCDWRKYVCDLFHGTQVYFDMLLFSSATDVETLVPLKQAQNQKVARIARRVANEWIERKNIADQFPDHKTEMQVKIQIAYDGMDEHQAQQRFMDRLVSEMGVRKAEIIMGGTDPQGIGVN